MIPLLILILNQIITLYAAIVLIYCLCSWFIRDNSNRFMQILAMISEPPLIPIRRFLWRFEFFRNSPVDFSPLVLFLLLRGLLSLLAQIPGWLS
ncbi:MAG: YggT family protein [Clostridia bacterium]|nr:YggT family protein [Clostridia bacterium]